MGRYRELIIRLIKIFGVIYLLTDGLIEKWVLQAHPELSVTEPKRLFYLKRLF
jgi:hypothetical protein